MNSGTYVAASWTLVHFFLSSEIKGSFWYLNISARWGHLCAFDQQMKHKHKPGSLEHQFGYSAYHNPHLQMKILCYFSFYSVTWSPVETHSHCLAGKGGAGPYWDKKAAITMNIYGPVLTVSQVREIRAHFSSRGERSVIVIIYIYKRLSNQPTGQ